MSWHETSFETPSDRHGGIGTEILPVSGYDSDVNAILRRQAEDTETSRIIGTEYGPFHHWMVRDVESSIPVEDGVSIEERVRALEARVIRVNDIIEEFRDDNEPEAILVLARDVLAEFNAELKEARKHLPRERATVGSVGVEASELIEVVV